MYLFYVSRTHKQRKKPVSDSKYRTEKAQTAQLIIYMYTMSHYHRKLNWLISKERNCLPFKLLCQYDHYE